MLVEIQQKIARMQRDGSLAKLQKQAIEHAKEGIKEPRAVNLPRTQSERFWQIDPSYTVPEDIADQNGRVFAPAGTTINPLQRGARLREPLLFISMKDPLQARALPSLLKRWPGARVVLTAGRWSELSAQLKRPIYFDQGGKLTQAFGVMATPALITQDPNQFELIGHEILP